MALSQEQKKKFFLFNLGGATIAGTCCGLSFVPWSGSGPSGPKTLRYGSWYPRFVLGSVDIENNGIKIPRELFVEASDSLGGERSDKEISFDEVTMKLGTKKLTAGDVFFKKSDGGEGEYYFAKHIWNTEFRLDNWEKKSWTELQNGSVKPSNGSGRGTVKAIKLKLKNGAGGGTDNQSMFVVGSCKFTLRNQENKPQEWKSIEMRCDCVNSGGTGNKIILEGDHQHHYVYTVTKK